MRSLSEVQSHELRRHSFPSNKSPLHSHNYDADMAFELIDDKYLLTTCPSKLSLQEA